MGSDETAGVERKTGASGVGDLVGDKPAPKCDRAGRPTSQRDRLDRPSAREAAAVVQRAVMLNTGMATAPAVGAHETSNIPRPWT